MPKFVLTPEHVREDYLSIYNIYVNVDINTVDLFACKTS